MLSAEMHDVIEKLAAAALAASRKFEEREAIAATGGVPVSYHWTGFTIVKGDGTVVFYSTEDNSVEPVADSQEALGALKKLAALHPSLGSLVPKRPASARECGLCGGAGIVIRFKHELECGECHGVGWRLQA
jgi:ribosomal protein S27AE